MTNRMATYAELLLMISELREKNQKLLAEIESLTERLIDSETKLCALERKL